jgi:hypothetical protein
MLDSKDKKSKIWYVGWKIFTGDGKGTKVCTTAYERTRLKIGEWLVDKSDKILTSILSPTYRTGYHFFRNKEDALKQAWSDEHIRKVKVRKIVATGKQFDCSTGVAREMFITDKVATGQRVSFFK